MKASLVCFLFPYFKISIYPITKEHFEKSEKTETEPGNNGQWQKRPTELFLGSQKDNPQFLYFPSPSANTVKPVDSYPFSSPHSIHLFSVAAPDKASANPQVPKSLCQFKHHSLCCEVKQSRPGRWTVRNPMHSFHISYTIPLQIVAPDTITKITRYEVNGMGRTISL